MSKPNNNALRPLHIFPQLFSVQPIPHRNQTPQSKLEPPSSAEIPTKHEAWVSGTGLLHHLFHDMKKASASRSPLMLGILSFETAKAMSRLISLYNSVTDDEIRRLRTEIFGSRGVAYLNSGDEGHLLFLACAERLSELNASAEAVARLSQRCSDPGLVRFDLVYADLKLGLSDPRKKLEFGSKDVVRIIEKMKKVTHATANLYATMESLAELELSERKLENWKKTGDQKKFEKTTFDLFHRKIGHLRKQVQGLRDNSLWNMTYDKSVSLMARIVCVVYARICVVFGPHISDREATMSSQNNQYHFCLLEDRKFHQRNRKRESKSGPILRTRKVAGNSNNNIFINFNKITGFEVGVNPDRVSRLAGPSTVGGSAMTVRYADVIVLAERCLHTPETVSEETRRGLYEMLPERLRNRVRAKLKESRAREPEAGGCEYGRALASGWREALEEIMTWLAPVAHDTVMWQAERKLERQRCCLNGGGERPSVLLVETLHFSDLEKTEAAIVEVLVGLSRVFRYENVGRRCDDNRRYKRYYYGRRY